MCRFKKDSERDAPWTDWSKMLQPQRVAEEAQGTSVGEFLARQARNLRQQLEKPWPPEIVAASGIIAAEADAKNEHRDHLQRKHR